MQNGCQPDLQQDIVHVKFAPAIDLKAGNCLFRAARGNPSRNRLRDLPDCLPWVTFIPALQLIEQLVVTHPSIHASQVLLIIGKYPHIINRLAECDAAFTFGGSLVWTRTAAMVCW